MGFNPASVAGGSCIPLSLCPSSPLSLPLSLLPVSPIPVRWRFPGWARCWGRPLHSGLGGGPGAARFPPRLSKLLISPHLATVAGPRRGGRGHCPQECLSVPPAGRAPPAAPPTMRRGQDMPASMAPSTGHPKRCGDQDRLHCCGGCRGTHGMATPAAGGPHPWDIPGCGTPSPQPSACWGAGASDGALGSGLPAQPWDTALATAGRRVPAWHVGQHGWCCPARQIASFPCQFWERGAQRGNSSLGHMALAGLSPAGGGGCFAQSRGCPAAEHIKAPSRPPPCRDHTGHGHAGPARGRWRLSVPW